MRGGRASELTAITAGASPEGAIGHQPVARPIQLADQGAKRVRRSDQRAHGALLETEPYLFDQVHHDPLHIIMFRPPPHQHLSSPPADFGAAPSSRELQRAVDKTRAAPPSLQGERHGVVPRHPLVHPAPSR